MVKQIIFMLAAGVVFSTCASEPAELNAQEEPATGQFPHQLTPVIEATLRAELNSDPQQADFGDLLQVHISRKGDIFVNDHQRQTIFRMDGQGRELSSFRSIGRGPGEFISKTLTDEPELRKTGIYDPFQHRLTIMDPGLNNVLDTYQVRGPSGIALRFLGFSEDGAFYKGFRGYGIYNYEAPRNLRIYVRKWEQESFELIATLPIDERFPIVFEDRRSVFLSHIPFGRRAHISKYKDELIYISGQGFSYTTYALDGTKTSIDSLAQDWRGYTFTRAQAEQHIEGNFYPPMSDSNLQNDIIKELWAAMDFEQTAFYKESFVDAQRRIWFELHPELFEDESRWIVWDTKTNHTFQVIFDEENVRVQGAIGNTVVAFKRNENDLQTVRFYTLSDESL